MRCCSDPSSLVPSAALAISVSEIQETMENVDVADGCCGSGLLGAAQPTCALAADGRAGHKRSLELADIFRQYGPAYRVDHRLSSEQLKVMYAIEHCHKAALRAARGCMRQLRPWPKRLQLMPQPPLPLAACCQR